MIRTVGFGARERDRQRHGHGEAQTEGLEKVCFESRLWTSVTVSLVASYLRCREGQTLELEAATPRFRDPLVHEYPFPACFCVQDASDVRGRICSN